MVLAKKEVFGKGLTDKKEDRVGRGTGDFTAVCRDFTQGHVERIIFMDGV